MAWVSQHVIYNTLIFLYHSPEYSHKYRLSFAPVVLLRRPYFNLIVFWIVLSDVWLCGRTRVALLPSPSTSCRRFIQSSGLSAICLLTARRSWLFPSQLVSSENSHCKVVISKLSLNFPCFCSFASF